MASPTILFLDHAAVLGGAELSLRDVVVHFGRRSHVVLLSDGPLRQILEEAGIRVSVVHLPARLGNSRREGGLLQAVAGGMGVAALARRLRPLVRAADLIYANSQKAFVIGACANLTARRPMIWHLRDILDPSHFSWVNRTVTTRLARVIRTRVIANSENTRRSFIAAGGSPEHIVTVHNGISPAACDAVDESQVLKLRKSLGFGPDDVLVGALSRLAPWKGQHVLIEAIAQLPANVHALIVGDALFGEDDYRAQLERQVRDLGLEHRVHMLGFRSDVPVLLKCCDIVAHTAIAPEPFGRVIVEGMLAHRPVIASDDGGAREIIRHEVDGLLIAPNEVMTLARTIRRLCEDPALADRLAHAGRARAESEFSVETMLSKLEHEIEATIDGGRRAAPARAAQGS